jgi:hypothetical protein
MTRDEYEQRKAWLAEQLRVGVGLLESAHQAQVRALDLVWMLQSTEKDAGGAWRETGTSAAAPATPAPEPPAPPPPPVPARRRSTAEVDTDVRKSFWRLPDTFTRADVCEMLGYEPDRGPLYRSLQDLVREGSLLVESPGSGQRATVYCKTVPSESPAQS